MYCRFFIVLTLLSNYIYAQDSTQSYNQLDSVIVSAFKKQAYSNAAISVGILTKKQIQQFGLQHTLSIINNIAGVKLEERSPNSYRLQIRGNLLRSPFGVRNIKVYYNDIPLSDAGSNTYLNLLELQHMQQIEIVKGPAASLYGVGNNGVLLMQQSPSFSLQKKQWLQANISVGSFGMLQQHIQYNFNHKKISYSILQSHTKGNGYRQQSAHKKNHLQFLGSYKLNNKHILNWYTFFTNLYYQTPGGITETQMLQNPTFARQATTTLPSAIQQQTAVFNKTVYTALQHNFKINNQWNVQTSLLGSITNFKNPFITNFEERSENNYGIRSKISYQKKQHEFSAGIEILRGNFNINVFNNNAGTKGNAQFSDEVKAQQSLLFAQYNFIKKQLQITTGISINNQQYWYKREGSIQYNNFVPTNTNYAVMPRLQIGYQLKKWLLYSIVSKGFSPASLQEIRPSDGNFYPTLQAEKGLNFEMGTKGNFWKNKLHVEFAMYTMNIKNAIVRRMNNNGAEFFINAGNVLQQGIEISYTYKIATTSNYSIQLMGSFTHQPHFFKNYQNGAINFNNNAVTGVPNYLFNNQLSFSFQKLTASIQLQWVNTTPLNDANTVFANSYRLVQLNSQYSISNKIKLFIGVDNVLNELYSLGNDINAAGNRFFNPAATRNFNGGIKINMQ
jgi:iron complex outermembrane recepter protein